MKTVLKVEDHLCALVLENDKTVMADLNSGDVLAEFEKKFDFITMHAGNLICDKFVYSMGSWKLLQDLSQVYSHQTVVKYRRTTCSVPYSDELLLVTEGYIGKARMQLWRWYEKQQLYYLQVRGEITQSFEYTWFHVKQMYKNLWNPRQNEFYFVFEECDIEFAQGALWRKYGGYTGASKLLRIQLNLSDPTKSCRYDVIMPREKIVAFRQYSHEDFVVVTDKSIHIGKNVDCQGQVYHHTWGNGDPSLSTVVLKTIYLEQVKSFTGVSFFQNFSQRVPFGLVSFLDPKGKACLQVLNLLENRIVCDL